MYIHILDAQERLKLPAVRHHRHRGHRRSSPQHKHNGSKPKDSEQMPRASSHTRGFGTETREASELKPQGLGAKTRKVSELKPARPRS